MGCWDVSVEVRLGDYSHLAGRRVLLFHPPTDLGHNFMPPLALAALHADTPEGYRVDVRDATNTPWSRLRAADFEPYDIIAVSVRYTYNNGGVTRLLEALARKFSEKIVITGGPQATHDVRGQFAAGVSHVVRFAGEGTWNELLTALRDGRSVEGIRGLAHRRDGEVVVEPDRGFIPPGELPIPTFEDFRATEYPLTKGYYGALLEASRGCPRDCAFCTEPATWNGRWASKSPERVVEEVDRLDALGFNFLIFADDNFGIHPGELRRLLEALAARRRVVPFMALVEPATVRNNPDIWDLAWRAGMRIVNLDTNTIDPETNAQYGRGAGMTRGIEEAMKIIRRSRIASVSNVVVGAPGETREQMRRNIRFSKKHADVYSNGALEPRPGNRYWNDAYYDQLDRFGKGEALAHEDPAMVRRVLHTAVLTYYLNPFNALRTWFSRKSGTRMLFRLQYRMYFHGAIRKFVRRSGSTAAASGVMELT